MGTWKDKLLAFLHDPPSKCLDIPTHEGRSEAALRQAGLVDECDIKAFYAHADHTGAAADRLPFPNSSAVGLRCAFDGVRNAFRHPLSGSPLTFEKEFPSVESAMETEGGIQPALAADCLAALPDDDVRWRARFFAHWRLWPKHAAELDYRFALLPADTRIPDHTIWTHMQVVSALAGCVDANKIWRPAFLKFQLGPVQDFIAASRSIRDLWSGSYLLSWLMAAGLKALSGEVGPDAVIFPNLRGQPLFDLHWRKDLWDKVRIGDKSASVWGSLGWDNQSLLTPNLPNVFLAVAPADRVTELGRLVETAIQEEWRRIADAVWETCKNAELTGDEGGFTEAERRNRFDTQISRFLSLSWNATPWPETLDEACKAAETFPERMPIQAARKRVLDVIRMATEQMPYDQRDRRYYTDNSKKTLNNIGLGWSVILALNSWELDAVRQTREFAGNPGGWTTGTHNNKDSLTGKEEAVAGGRIWTEKAKTGPLAYLFNHDDWLGAPSLVKRVWHKAYLEQVWEMPTDPDRFRMPDTRKVAEGRPDEKGDDNDLKEDASEKYFAVLALDGDEIGKWVSGEKTPKFATQLADYRDGSGKHGARVYFERPATAGFLECQRPLSPSYHLQFSEALSNFALLCARPIVEAHHGRLIYAGGDDVLALLPADTALDCAAVLRQAFTGRKVTGPGDKVLFWSPGPGFLSSKQWVDGTGNKIPFPVPGPKADCSVGIAIAHFKAPLQDIVRAAQAAEKRAKKDLGRRAVAVTLMKRSGETIQWGCKWEAGGLELYAAIKHALENDLLTARFPYRVSELIEPYLVSKTEMRKSEPVSEFQNSVDAILRAEFAVACSRQKGKSWNSGLMKHLRELLTGYLANLNVIGADAETKVAALLGLCQTVAFAHRTSSDGKETQS